MVVHSSRCNLIKVLLRVLLEMQVIDLGDITVSDTLTADTIKTTTLNGLFGADTIWTIGSTPELNLN